MKFKPGDRVAVYESGKRYEGQILAMISDEVLHFANDSGKGLETAFHVHSKQCRRLTPKAKQFKNGEWVWVKAVYIVDASRPGDNRHLIAINDYLGLVDSSKIKGLPANKPT